MLRYGREGFWGKSRENSLIFTDSGDSDSTGKTLLAKLEPGGGGEGGLSVADDIPGGHFMVGTGSK